MKMSGLKEDMLVVMVLEEDLKDKFGSIPAGGLLPVANQPACRHPLRP